MQVKIFEVRDEGTHIEVFALSTEAAEGQEYGLRRCGFLSGEAIILGYLDGERNSSADPYHWRDRTMHAAHQYLLNHFHSLPNGAVIDVRFILGETFFPCASDSERG